MKLANKPRRSIRAAMVVMTATLGVFAWVGPSRPAMAQADNTQAPALSAADVAAITAGVQTVLANIDPNLTGAARQAAITQALQQFAVAQIALNGTAAIAPIINAATLDNIPIPVSVAALLPAAATAGIAAPQAVAAVTVGAIAAGASATQASQAVIAVSAQTGLSSAAVGTGLGQAAATLARSNNAGGANQIAQVVSNEGTLGTGQAFSASVVATGGSQQLANAGQQNPNAASLTGATGATAASTLAVANTNAGSSPNGVSQQISSVGTTISCTSPSCN
jgi:hypothetical protein